MNTDNGERNRISDLSNYKPVFWIVVFWFIIFIGIITGVELRVF